MTRRPTAKHCVKPAVVTNTTTLRPMRRWRAHPNHDNLGSKKLAIVGLKGNMVASTGERGMRRYIAGVLIALIVGGIIAWGRRQLDRWGSEIGV